MLLLSVGAIDLAAPVACAYHAKHRLPLGTVYRTARLGPLRTIGLRILIPGRIFQRKFISCTMHIKARHALVPASLVRSPADCAPC